MAWPAVPERDRMRRVADGFAVALVASLPWSTSATGILVVLWLLAAMPTLSLRAVCDEAATAAGGLPVLLWALGVVGMLWADVSWSERLGGLSGFHKLLLIPLFLAYFRHSNGGRAVLIGFLVSSSALMAASWIGFAGLSLGLDMPFGTTPVKDYISQGAMFSIAIMMLAHLGLEAWRTDRTRRAGLFLLLAGLFVLNMLIVVSSRTALVVLPFLVLWYGAIRLRLRGMFGLAAILAVLGGVGWSAAGWREQATKFVQEITEFRPDAAPTRAGERLIYWTKSLDILSEAPALGHGTGSIRSQFERRAGTVGMDAHVADNPHNQTLAVGLQIGALGMLVLWAMWFAHLRLTFGGSLAALAGSVIVLQNVIGSLFNSHVFDFTHGWLYVIGLGIAGGSILRERHAAPAPTHALPSPSDPKP
jgi:O-antigen ligase